MPYSYKLNAGQYVLHDGDRPVGRVMDAVGLAFDKVEGALYKHGEAAAIQSWVTERQARLRDAGCDGMADNLVCLSGRLPVDELNACLANGGRLPLLYERALKGELAEEPFPEALPLPSHRPPALAPCGRRSRP